VKVVFLDFDGVLNSAQGPVGQKGLLGLCSTKVGMVDRICVRTGAKIVVSSTWRLNNDLAALRDLLVTHGLSDPALVIDVTPDLVRRPMGDSMLYTVPERGDEIADWLQQHPEVTHFVILDDDSDMGALAPHLVKTSFQTGLLPEHVEQAVEILLRLKSKASEAA
jgi:hypothetical protein